ncbi:uncharacterized protein METZ01_LOCUS230934, partial [marine metagenome]
MNMLTNGNSQTWNFQNSYIELPAKLFMKQLPISVNNPQIIYFNKGLAKELGLEFISENQTMVADYFSGNKIPEGSAPIAQAYAGHQFGHFTMLGDGRVILLGEQINPDNKRYDIQLKGSGQTPYSRGGDGRATLSSMLREYIISESIHHLGIPTTRSLAVTQTGEKVYRETVNDGAVLTRIASSHIRVGTFEYVNNFCSKEDLQIFIKYVIDRHYPEISGADNPALELLKVVMLRQIALIVNWLRVGFIHGVMNTDNMSIAGETMDYGPCAFMNRYNPRTVFSSIDINGRYAFGNQSTIAHWNLAVFASTLLPFISDNKEKAIQLAEETLNKFPEEFSMNWYQMMYKKLGILKPIQEDKVLVDMLLQLMDNHQADYTNTFAALTLNKVSDDNLFSSSKFNEWRKQWENRTNHIDNRINALKLMQTQNPLVISRNHLVESALENAIKGNKSQFNELLNLISKPYNY